MTIIAFNRYWVVRWPWVLINLLVLALLLGLSFWQWQRAAEKTQTLARIAKWQQQGAVDIARLTTINAIGRDGVQMDFMGRWLAPMVWLVDNKMVNGRIGYDVIIAVEDVSASDPVHGASQEKPAALLVNLGWVAAPLQRDVLPALDIPTEMRVQGIFRSRITGVLLGTNIENKGTWPMRIQQVDIESLSVHLNRPLIYGLTYQEKNSPYLIHYRPVILPPERHKAYALQWFLLAIAVVVIALLASARKHPQGIEL
ncbi:SURF1 family protein [Cellvibrio fibrivorans]|uniref:SURF1-like protein n=1 Tax=Cellvibrio fibrivorans TaxID=126350 RepID=A0ABU1US91_9GAMM|nr:SURF1 family protein [Cellvibrio fibrivorans]MDR7088015.1 cytochrome oxidase assembly protein ShyY1 [Cellvibrio fibrivorans]